MPTIADALMPTLFLVALVLLARGRAALVLIDPRGYQRLSLGISLLTLGALGQMYLRTGLLDSIIASFDPFFIELVGWAMTVTGIVLVASGTSTMLPLVRRFRRMGETGPLTTMFLSRVEKVSTTEPSLDVVLTKTLNEMISAFGLATGAVYKYSKRTGRLVLRSVADSPHPGAREFLANADFNQEAFLDLAEHGTPTVSDIFSDASRSTPAPDLLVPILLGHDPVGCYVLWSGSRDCSAEERDACALAANFVAGRVDRDRWRLMATAHESQLELIKTLAAATRGSATLADILPHLFRHLSELMPMDLITVVLADSSRDRFNRYSVGRTGALLTEKNMSWTGIGAQIDKLPRLETSEIYSVLAIEENKPLSLLLGGSTEGTLLTDRLDLEGPRVALIGVTANGQSLFGPKEIDLMTVVRPFLSAAISDEFSQMAREQAATTTSPLRQMIAELSACGDIQEILERTSKILLRDSEISAVRISMIDGPEFLKSYFLGCQSEMAGIVPGGGTQIISLMPAHRKALATNRAVVVESLSDEPTLSAAETGQMLNEKVTSALICPIPVGGVTSGTLTLMSTSVTNSNVGSPEQIELSTAISSLLGLVIPKTEQADHELLASKEAATADPAQRQSIRSSLTGILGSVELLKQASAADDTSLDRYLSILDRSAQKLSSILQDTDNPA